MKDFMLAIRLFVRQMFHIDWSIYVGCALTSMPQDYIDSVAMMKQTMRSLLRGWTVLEFLGKTLGTARQVVEFDLGCVKSSRLFVVIVDNLSHGVGMEIDRADVWKVPMLFVARRDTKITRMILGLQEKYPHRVRIERHDALSEIPTIAQKAVEEGFYRKPFLTGWLEGPFLLVPEHIFVRGKLSAQGPKSRL